MEIHRCGYSWVYCDGDCTNCTERYIRYAESTESESINETTESE